MRSFKHKLSNVFRLWNDKDYDTALDEVESLLNAWPGNARLHVLWASLVQLQDNPKHSLEAVKRALQQAIDLDEASPAGAMELGHFLDEVQDDPRAAAKMYAEAVAQARRLLIEGLIAQAKTLLQLDKKKETMKCLLELLSLTKTGSSSKRPKSERAAPDIIFRSPMGQVSTFQLNGPYAAQIEELVNEVLVNRSA